MPQPLFISFDGVDGTGKSTQIERLVHWLKEQGREVVTCRDPGSTTLGEALRSIVLGQSDEEAQIGGRAEALIYMAARAQLVEEIIRPALEAGHVVVADRFLLATVVYQGYGLELGADELWSVGDFATGKLLPDLTLVLDLDVDTAAARRTGNGDRIEQRDQTYFQKLRDGFLAEAKEKPDQIFVIDASQTIDDVQSSIQDAVSKCLNG